VLDAGDRVLERCDLGIELGEAVGGRLLVAVDCGADASRDEIDVPRDRADRVLPAAMASEMPTAARIGDLEGLLGSEGITRVLLGSTAVDFSLTGFPNY